jgi:hypothetical protein
MGRFKQEGAPAGLAGDTLVGMRLEIRGRDLPGSSYAGHERIGVGLQVRSEPDAVVPGDAASARWETDVTVVDGDFRGPAVQGRRGERFVYLTWGDLSDGGFEMFRRAKLMLSRVDPAVIEDATAEGFRLVAEVVLTDDRGGPRCARVDPPAVHWSAEPA